MQQFWDSCFHNFYCQKVFPATRFLFFFSSVSHRYCLGNVPEAASHFANVVRVYPNPPELLGVLQQKLPPPIFAALINELSIAVGIVEIIHMTFMNMYVCMYVCI